MFKMTGIKLEENDFKNKKATVLTVALSYGN